VPSRSSTSTAAPSPITKPSRRASNGREMPVWERASRALNAARASGVKPASEPPATTASASPACSMRSAPPIACAPEAHAELTANEGPRRSWRIDSAPAPALLIISGTDSGETYCAPRSRSVSWPSTSVWMPPMPVPSTQPTRAGSYGRPSARPGSASQPASASASAHAAIASCVKRSARRASLAERKSFGSKSAHAPSPSAIPHSPAHQRSCRVRAPTPRGVTAPTPVITTASDCALRAIVATAPTAATRSAAQRLGRS
jgi:hypothetical protein